MDITSRTADLDTGLSIAYSLLQEEEPRRWRFDLPSPSYRTEPCEDGADAFDGFVARWWPGQAPDWE